MISYPVDAASRWSILQLSTGQIIARNRSWPRADGQPVEGQDPDFVYLLQLSTAEPDYDSRLYTLESVEVVDAPENAIRRTWSAVPRPGVERTAAAENEESRQFGRHVQLSRVVLDLCLAVGYLSAKVIDGQALPQKAINVVDRIKRVAVKLQQNRDRHTANLAEIAANRDPDLDTGWANPDA